LTHTEWASAHEKFYTAIIRDITHRKQIEQELSNKEAYLNAVISSSGEAIITLNSEGIMETVNPKAQQLFGYPCHEMLGKNISTLILLPQKEWLNNDYYLHPSEFLYSVNQGDKECDGMRRDGEIFALELNISPMIIANQKKFVGILRDISENKQFLYEIMQAKSGAEAANRAKNQFLASMSHEFRTPLNAIMGFTQLLQTDTENPLNAEQLDFLNYIHDGGTRLLTLINDILDLSKIESGGLALQCENFALVQFVNEIITQIKPLVTQANLTINKLSDENLFFVKTDKLKLQQVINQLLSNAIKYNRPQGSISIYLTQVEKKIRLSISDTGKGISEQLLPELFKSFSRLDAQVGTIEGTGIGLTVAKKLIEMMNGKIGVTSRVGEGSTFWIELNSVSD
jgi:PAS domain S-box-containing protein